MFGLSTLNSNRNNHKLRKKLANQKRRHMYLGLCWIRTQYCALIRRRYTEGLERLRRRQCFCRLAICFVLWELIFAIRTLVFLAGNSFFWRFSESTQYPALKIFSILLITCNRNTYYSTIMSFYHIRSRERAKYEAVIQRSALGLQQGEYRRMQKEQLWLNWTNRRMKIK